jgi:hypothetical protein
VAVDSSASPDPSKKRCGGRGARPIVRGDASKFAAAVVDALQSLHEAEQGSVFRLMGEGSPS